jgi:MFS family permease
LTGYHLLGVGVAGIFFVPSARLWGKRHLYILGTVLLIFSSIWGGAARSYKSLLWARVFQGIAIAPFEALVNASVGDLYPVHLRGTRMAFTNFALFGGAFFTPVIVGKMTETMFWRWPFYFVAIFAAIFAPLVFLFVPETSYRRKVDTDSISTNNLLLRTAVDPNFDDSKQSEDRSDNKSTPTPQRKRDSFVRRLRLFNGRKTDANLIQLLIRPFPLLFHPAIIWGMLIQGVMIGWTVMIGVVLGLIFMLPPLWFSETEVGYMYSGAFFGATIGFILSGILSDFSAKWLAKINNGVYEPEFRIILVIPQLVIGAAGLFGFGWYSEHVTLATKFVPSVFFGLEVMGMVLGATGSALYLVDSYREVAVEAFTCLLIFKNFFSYVLTYYAVDWVQVNGPWKLFQTIGIIQIGICLLSVPMYIYGKKIRSFTHRHEIMKRISWLNVNEK